MKEGKQNIDYFKLISKYLSGNANELEVKQLEDWVLASPENKEQFKAYKKAWILSGINHNIKEIDVDKEWVNTAKQLFSEKKENIRQISAKPRYRIGNIFRIAAAAAIILITSLWMYRYLEKDKYVNVVAQNNIEESILPDSSMIYLNRYSSVKYPTMKNKKHRMVELTGDAFFEVKRDTAHSFIVKADDIRVEVLGTSFYVDARKDQTQIVVIVKSGTVAVASKDKKIILKAGEAGIYNKNTGALIKKQNKDHNYLAWKTDLLIFEKTSLEDVVFDLNRKFHTDISIGNPQLGSCEITATFNKKSLDAIINIIEKTLKIKAEKKDGRIIFTGEGCN